MKTTLFILWLSSSLLQANDHKVGLCDVKHVYSGSSGTFLILHNCSKELGFSEKEYNLRHHQSITVIEQIMGAHEKVVFDNVGDILGIKQTAELAYLFQRKVSLEISSSNELLFMSLAHPINLPTAKTSKNESPVDPAPTSPEDGFVPVPNPQKSR